jgi:hypothetical protein
MKKVNLLSRAEMKKVMGGQEKMQGGSCWTCNCKNGESSSWFTYNLADLCNRVCGVGGWSSADSVSDCNGATMR